MRYFLYLSYNGTRYHGWQKQPKSISVQEVLEEKLSIVLRKPIELVGSGRTDSGVHAKLQVAHFNFDEALNLNDCIYKFNKILPPDIAIHNLVKVKEEAHARFDALSRSYEYYIDLLKNPFRTGLSYHYTNTLDVAAMNEAAKHLLGKQDFESFSKVKTDVHTFNCDIFEARWEKDNDQLIFYVSANRFLRGMVRALVGTLLDVGTGKISSADFKQIIAAKDRTKAGRAVPPHGLYLTDIIYPKENFQI